MTPEQQERLEACLEEAAHILYEDTPQVELQTLEGIERAVRGHLLKQVGPQLGHFLSAQRQVHSRDEPDSSKAASEV